MEKRLVRISAVGMTNGVVGGGMFAQPENVDIHRGTAQPFAQAVGQRFISPFAEFSDHLSHAARRQVHWQAGNNPPLDVFA